MPMVWMGKIRGHSEMRRVYGPDLMLDVCAWSEKNPCRHFFFGGADGVAELLAQKLKAKFSKMEIAGTFTPPFRPFNVEEEKQFAETIRAARPDILWVGLSTPKQEKFMAEFLPKLDATLMIGVGAAFDFHSGRVRQAPRWMQRSGLEWFYRLCQRAATAGETLFQKQSALRAENRRTTLRLEKISAGLNLRYAIFDLRTFHKSAALRNSCIVNRK